MTPDDPKAPPTVLSRIVRAAMRERLENTLLLHIRAAGLPEPEREWAFAKPRRFRFDFAWVERKLAVEVQGGLWVSGRHVRPAGYESDCEKQNLAVKMGWRLLVFTAEMINSGEALRFIESILKEES